MYFGIFFLDCSITKSICFYFILIYLFTFNGILNNSDIGVVIIGVLRSKTKKLLAFLEDFEYFMNSVFSLTFEVKRLLQEIEMIHQDIG